VTRSLDGTSKEECRPQYKQTTNFWWVQQVKVDTNSLTASRRINFLDTIKNNNSDLNPRELRMLNTRVWFVSDFIYFINDNFGSFIDKQNTITMVQ
jgi:hypothetical protein